MAEGGDPFLPWLGAANEAWRFNIEDLRLIEAESTLPIHLRSAAAVVADVKDAVGHEYSGQELQSVLVNLAARLSTVPDLDPEELSRKLPRVIAIAHRSARRGPPARSRLPLVVALTLLGLLLVMVALAAARVPLPGKVDDVIRDIWSHPESALPTYDAHTHKASTISTGTSYFEREPYIGHHAARIFGRINSTLARRNDAGEPGRRLALGHDKQKPKHRQPRSRPTTQGSQEDRSARLAPQGKDRGGAHNAYRPKQHRERSKPAGRRAP